MYKVTNYMLPELEKRIKAICKKLDRYNLMYDFQKQNPVIEKVNVYQIDQFGVRCKIGEKVVEVIPYTFWMEELKVGNWKPIARIEHGALTVDGETKNMVHAVNGVQIEDEWWTIKSKCDHCGHNRHRKVTILLENIQGEVKQVGSSCLGEFTGIDANDIISLYTSIDDIYIEEAYESTYSQYVQPSGYIPTVEFLSVAIELCQVNGYEKEVTKRVAFERASNNKPNDSYVSQANKMIDFFKTLDIDILPSWEQSFYRDIQTAVTQEYCKCNGLIAYAPVAYDKVQTIIAEAELKAAEPVSAWQGDVGSKISVQVTLSKSIGYDTQWGYCYIHLFKDADGNVYKWSTGSSLADRKVDGILTGTIKAHDEYDGQKQTTVTRCKIS